MNRKIGAHVSIAGGVDKAVARAHELGANCMQIFSGSPRMWKRTPLEKIDRDEVFAKQKEFNVKPIFTHALYLVNLASDQSELIQKTVRALKHDLRFDNYIKGSGVIVHLGSHQGRGWDQVKDQVVRLIKQVLKNTPKSSNLLIENSAGQKGKVASDLKEISWLLDQINSSRLSWCFDTCHAHAAGLKLAEATRQINQLKLWSSLKCIHVNDSKDQLGAGRDRHENIGEGQIPSQELKRFINHHRVKSLPILIEVPGFDNKGPDKKNLDRLKKLTT